MEACRLWEAALEFTHGQKFQDPSVINSSVLSAVRGEHGDFHATEKTKKSRLRISPLMPLYWFFDLPPVAERNLFLPALRWTTTSGEAAQAMAMVRRSLVIRQPGLAPLS